MARLPPIDTDTMTPEAKRAYDEILRVRGQVRGPFAIWLSGSPELCEMALKLQDWFPKHAKFERRLLELMILVLARKSNAQFAWTYLNGSSVGASRCTRCSRSESQRPSFVLHALFPEVSSHLQSRFAVSWVSG